MTGIDPVRAWLGLTEVDLYCALLALLFTGVTMLLALPFVFPEKPR